MDDFRRFFLRGLTALVPTLLTIAILVWAYKLINENVGATITKGLVSLCTWISDEPAVGVVDEGEDPLKYGTPIDQWDVITGRRLTIEHKVIHHPALASSNSDIAAEARKARNRALWLIAAQKYRLHLLGFLIAIILVYFTGFFLASFIGRASWRAAEGVLRKIPLIKTIYPNIKQVTDFLLAERSVGFSGVVAVQYPRKGIWSLGLSTGDPMKAVQDASEDEMITLFIPSSPTPITGYVIQVPRKDVIILDMSIDDGLRFTISGGVIKPGQMIPGSLSSDGEDK